MQCKAPRNNRSIFVAYKMFPRSDNLVFQPRQNVNRNEDFHEELNDLFNKKFSFRYNSDWKLPELDHWFSSPPWKVKDLEIQKSRLNFHKSQLNDFNIEEWSSHTRRRNPAGEVGWKIRCLVNPEFLTQAWTKFYECASTYNVIPKQATTEKAMVSLHLCEAPGAFITSLNHYLKQNHQDVQVIMPLTFIQNWLPSAGSKATKSKGIFY